MDEEDLKDVELYLANNSDLYEDLHSMLESTVQSIAQELGPNFIHNYYSRSDKQINSGLRRPHLKSPYKVALACQKDKKNKNIGHKIREIEDIVGITVVCCYPDQIDKIVEKISTQAASKRLILCAQKIKSDKGYFAKHVVFKSNCRKHRNFKCELQIKTMLHDAWSAKTHDLTYKPGGSHDPRLASMMSLFANTLENVEVTSQLLRDLIRERWQLENKLRRITRKTIYNSHINQIKKRAFSAEGKKILDELLTYTTEDKDKLLSNQLAEDFSAEIDSLDNSKSAEAYLLEACLAIITDRPGDRKRAVSRATTWLAEVSVSLTKENCGENPDIRYLPVIVYACGEANTAINLSNQLLGNSALDTYSKRIISFNLANWLIERAYFTSMTNDKNKSHIEKLLKFSEPLRSEDASAFFDIEGMLLVVFGTTAAQVKQGIEKIEEGMKNVPPAEIAIAKATYNVHVRIGWRKLLDMESSQTMDI